MKKSILFNLILILTFAFSYQDVDGQTTVQKTTEDIIVGGGYTLVVEGYDWGAAVSKVILSNDKVVTDVDKNNYTVFVKKHTDCMELTVDRASGERSVVHAYVSDSKGSFKKEGSFITLVLAVGPNLQIGSPLQYTRNDKCRGNKWVDYNMIIIDKASQQVWNKESDRIMPLIDQFDLTGSFVYDKDLTMSYAAYAPKKVNKKSSLIIWLHGGGEGGTDPTIPLLANKAANYASPDIQKYFGGAHVLVPQCPTAWMRNAAGATTRGKDNDINNAGLMALIKDYVASHPDIDPNKIYVGGCSNGGYMSLKLILLYPDYFAAGYISALAFQSQYITDEQIQQIKNVPIWFIHSKDDPTTLPEKTAVPVYERLMKAGAPNVHFSYYDHVIDLTGFYGGENYLFNGHWSWIYSHANHCTLDFDGRPVMLEGRPVSIMEWIANQSKLVVNQ